MLAVIGALFANGLIAILKLAAALITGSSGMMAEALHSVADTTNQVFLLLGLRFYRRPASDKHPFGYGKERFFWSFIAAIFIFGVGATYALYEGYQKLRHPHAPENLSGAYWDGLASMAIGVVLAIVAFVLARSSRGLLLGEAATPKSVSAIQSAIESHPNVCEVVELLTMHLAPKQILINAHVNLRDDLATDDIERTNQEIEE